VVYELGKSEQYTIISGKERAEGSGKIADNDVDEERPRKQESKKKFNSKQKETHCVPVHLGHPDRNHLNGSLFCHSA
jgi:hypothetical protein